MKIRTNLLHSPKNLNKAYYAERAKEAAERPKSHTVSRAVNEKGNRHQRVKEDRMSEGAAALQGIFK